MKKTVTFDLDWDIKPAIKLAAKKAGQDTDFFANDLLRKALGMEVYQEYNTNYINLEKGGMDPEFINWAKTNIPVNEKIYKQEKHNQVLQEMPYLQTFLTQKRFSTWINYYATMKGLKVITGKSFGKKWALLYSAEK